MRHWTCTAYSSSNVLSAFFSFTVFKLKGRISSESCIKRKMLLCQSNANANRRVRTAHGKPVKSWNLRVSFSRPGKSRNLIVGP